MNHTDLPRAEQLALAGVDEATQRLAARAVHRAARDAGDERELLDALGLPAAAPAATTADAPINTRTEVTP